MGLCFYSFLARLIQPLHFEASIVCFFWYGAGLFTYRILGWNQNALQPLKDYLLEKNSKSFMILVNGRIVIEEYFDGHTSTTSWPGNSAGKTLVTSTTGIVQLVLIKIP